MGPLIVDSFKLIAGSNSESQKGQGTRRASLLSTLDCPLSTRSRGFTLIEILVVLGIVTLVAALGVPVYNALSGTRSIEAAQNQVSAYLGQARTIAINEGKSAGVLFYVDPATERTAMAIVYVGDTTLEDPDPYDKYKSWMSGVQYRTGDPDPDGNGDTSDRTRADRVTGMVSDADSTYDSLSYPQGNEPNFAAYTEPQRYFGTFRPAVRVWRSARQHTAANVPATAATVPPSDIRARPPRTGPGGTMRGVATIPSYQPPVTVTQSESFDRKYGHYNWSIADGRIISQYSQSEQQLLPKGVGVQVMIEPTSRTGGGYKDRYVRTGIILFDSQGRLVLRDVKLPHNTPLGEYLELASPGASALVSGLGLAFYNDSDFRSLNLNGAQPSQSDWIYGGTAPSNVYAFSSTVATLQDLPATESAEQAEENWLVNNTVPVMVNRFSGSLSIAE